VRKGGGGGWSGGGDGGGVVVTGEYRSVEFEVVNLAEFPLCALTLQIRQVGDWGDCTWDQINLDIDCDEAQETRGAGGGGGRGGGLGYSYPGWWTARCWKLWCKGVPAVACLSAPLSLAT
jgi:hypothetical protein